MVPISAYSNTYLLICPAGCHFWSGVFPGRPGPSTTYTSNIGFLHHLSCSCCVSRISPEMARWIPVRRPCGLGLMPDLCLICTNYPCFQGSEKCTFASPFLFGCLPSEFESFVTARRKLDFLFLLSCQSSALICFWNVKPVLLFRTR